MLPKKSDFSESVEEIQSAYWNKTNVNFILLEYTTNDKMTISLSHRSMAVVFDEQAQSPFTVLAYKVVPLVKEIATGLQIIHYWTDRQSNKPVQEQDNL